MKRSPPRLSLRGFLLALAVPMALLPGASAMAAPGAHGPNGEHLDGPAAIAGTGTTAPRIEAKSEAFELVGTLHGDEFSMLINRFETNEPVLDAEVEVESGPARAQAKFHADLGDYAVDDAAFLKVLKAPGEHAIVVTVMAGAEADLLDATLKTPAAATTDPHGHDHGESSGHGLSLTAWLALALLGLGALIFFLNRRPSTSRGAAQ